MSTAHCTAGQVSHNAETLHDVQAMKKTRDFNVICNLSKYCLILKLHQVNLPPTAFKGNTTPEFCATFVLFCAVYVELCAMLLVADSDIMPCVQGRERMRGERWRATGE